MHSFPFGFMQLYFGLTEAPYIHSTIVPEAQKSFGVLWGAHFEHSILIIQIRRFNFVFKFVFRYETGCLLLQFDLLFSFYLKQQQQPRPIVVAYTVQEKV